MDSTSCTGGPDYSEMVVSFHPVREVAPTAHPRVGYDARHAIFRPGPHNAPPAGPNSAPPAVSALLNGCHGGAGAAALRLRPPARL